MDAAGVQRCRTVGKHARPIRLVLVELEATLRKHHGFEGNRILAPRFPDFRTTPRGSPPSHCSRPCPRTSGHRKKYGSLSICFPPRCLNTTKTPQNRVSTSFTTMRLRPLGTTTSRSATSWKIATTRTISRSFFERASSPEQYEQRRQAIIQFYIDAVRQARQSGAQLLHTQFDAEDFDQVLDLCPEALDRWLEGMDPPTGEFGRRVRLAEGFYVGLCEAVLRRDPSRGIPLWRTLQLCLTTRFIGLTGIDRLKYAPFMAPDCFAVESILEELYALEEVRTDEDLFDIVVAARSFGRVDWLRRKISSDENSPCPAQQRRAAFLQPLLIRPTISGDAAWPSGPPTGGYLEIHDRSWTMGQREAFAAHWLRKFAEADTTEAAHAFWLLFMGLQRPARQDMDVSGLQPICSWERVHRGPKAAVRGTAEASPQTRHNGQRKVAAADFHHTESHEEPSALESTIAVLSYTGVNTAEGFQPLQNCYSTSPFGISFLRDVIGLACLPASISRAEQYSGQFGHRVSSKIR